MHGYCSVEWTQPLHALSAREHITRIYRYCLAHYTRNVSKLRGHVNESILTAMMSLASADPLPDFNATLAFIRSGGKKAVGKQLFFCDICHFILYATTRLVIG